MRHVVGVSHQTTAVLHSTSKVHAPSHDSLTLQSAIESMKLGDDALKDKMTQSVMEIRFETRELFPNLDAFFQLEDMIATGVATAMPKNAVAESESIWLPDDIHQQDAPLSMQLSILYAPAVGAKPKFDKSDRHLVQQVGLERDASKLEQGDRLYFTYTAAPFKKAGSDTCKGNVCETDASRLLEVVHSKIIVDAGANSCFGQMEQLRRE